RELEWTHAVREVQHRCERKLLEAETAAFADVVSLDELGALAEHRADRVKRQQQHEKPGKREHAEGGKRNNAQADTMAGCGQKSERDQYKGRHREMKPGPAREA